MATSLVAYFSASNVTKHLATSLASQLQADTFEIQPVDAYSSADLDWTNPESRSSIEMKDPSSRPAVVGPKLDLSGYDTIYLGFPIWWYVAPRIVNTFLEANDFSDKKIVVFATAGSSDFGDTLGSLQVSLPDDVDLVASKVVYGSATDGDISEIINCA